MHSEEERSAPREATNNPRTLIILIIIMCIYHALINALSAHIIHINLNMILYTHAEHSPTKTIYIKYHTKRNTKEKEKKEK